MNIEVRVQTRAKENSVEKTPLGYRVRTTASPHDNEANEAVLRLVADYFGVAVSRVELVRGHSSKQKILKVG